MKFVGIILCVSTFVLLTEACKYKFTYCNASADCCDSEAGTLCRRGQCIPAEYLVGYTPLDIGQPCIVHEDCTSGLCHADICVNATVTTAVINPMTYLASHAYKFFTSASSMNWHQAHVFCHNNHGHLYVPTKGDVWNFSNHSRHYWIDAQFVEKSNQWSTAEGKDVTEILRHMWVHGTYPQFGCAVLRAEEGLSASRNCSELIFMGKDLHPACVNNEEDQRSIFAQIVGYITGFFSHLRG
ncbi:hypothetical protein Ciccas_014402 [Cichlidogyrus casuarinus]|uniref:C-type lectin domain-containing protein n=1 Tax=Cichlidogyrus casuarinus TaxID=1844966 RepID=A0ABD2PJC1_9PLAT